MTSLPLPLKADNEVDVKLKDHDYEKKVEISTMNELAVECYKNIDLNSGRDSSDIMLDVVSNIIGLDLVECRIQKVLDELKIDFAVFMRVLLTKAFKDIKDIKDIKDNTNNIQDQDQDQDKKDSLKNYHLVYNMKNFSGKLKNMNLNVKTWLLILQFVNGCSTDRTNRIFGADSEISTSFCIESLINFLNLFHVKDPGIINDFLTKYVIKDWQNIEEFIHTINRNPDEMFINHLKFIFPWLVKCEKDYIEANNEFVRMMIFIEKEKTKNH